MQLSRRLSAIAEMVTPGNRLADIGCDHGYLPVYLLLEKKIPGAIAMDVRSGPLSSAREHIAEFGLGEYIETRLSDGLAALNPGEVDTVVIAGMGGPLMERILSEGQEVVASLKELILQPQSDLPHFRRYLLEHGLRIEEERIVLEDGKYYFPMKVVHGKAERWTASELAFGKGLLKEKNPLLLRYLFWKKGICEGIRRQLPENGNEAAQKRILEVKEEEALIQAALAYYEM